jgi:GNAT superfamily N-acetyltransferase
MIFIKHANLLTNCERTLINTLILSCFQSSRISTYDTMIWYQDDQHIIGCMGYHTNQYYDPAFGHITILNQLCVHENHRCKGIATDLLRYTEATQQATLILYIDKNEPDTEQLYNFYKMRGYQDIDDIDQKLPHKWNARYLPDIEYLMIKPKNAKIC